MKSHTAGPQRIVIVGGGAGGLELATRLGDRLGKAKRALVTLVDQSRTHLWKPLLHQVAAGTMDLNDHELDYLFQARWHHFQFRLGRMIGLDRQNRQVSLAATLDERSREVIPARTIPYDRLVICVGSTTNDFGTPGAAEHAIALDDPHQAALFHSRLINACLRANTQSGPLAPGQLNIAIWPIHLTGPEHRNPLNIGGLLLRRHHTHGVQNCCVRSIACLQVVVGEVRLDGEPKSPLSVQAPRG